MYSSKESHTPSSVIAIKEGGECCSTCGAAFAPNSLTVSCPCCSRKCCYRCVRAECALSVGSRSVKVCIDCFSMLQGSQCLVAAVDNVDREISSKSDTDTPTLCEVRWTQVAAGGNLKGSLLGRYTTPGTEVVAQSAGGFISECEGEGSSSSCPLCSDSFAAIAEPTVAKLLEEITQLNTERHDLMDRLSQSVVETETAKFRMKQLYSKLECSEELIRELQQRVLVDREVVAPNGCEVSNSSRSVLLPVGRRLPRSIVKSTVLTVVSPVKFPTFFKGAKLDDWGFDTLEMSMCVPSVLQVVAVEVANRWSLFDTLDEMGKWASMTAALENNYRPNPYHNAVHAADVLQGAFSLVSSTKVLLRHLKSVELKAIMFAAAAHDVRHPGRSNGFLTAVNDPLCFQFPGCGTLEQMHASTALQLLEVPLLNFAGLMNDATYLSFRNSVVRLIMCTDMGMHSRRLEHWRMKIRNGGFDFTKAEDRIDALSLILVAADLGACTRGVAIAKRWLVVLDEMAEQAEEEEKRELPVTPGFARQECLEGSQIAFLDHVVIPIFDVVQQLLPGIEVPMKNLRELRALYAEKAGVSTPFPDVGSSQQHGKSFQASMPYGQQRAECRGPRKAVGTTTKAADKTRGKQSVKAPAGLMDPGGAGRTRCSPDDRPQSSETAVASRMRHNESLSPCGQGSSRPHWRSDPKATFCRLPMWGRHDDDFPDDCGAWCPHRQGPSGNERPVPEWVSPGRELKKQSLELSLSRTVRSQQFDGVRSNSAESRCGASRSNEGFSQKCNEMDNLLLRVRAMRVGNTTFQSEGERQRRLHASLEQRDAVVAETAGILHSRRVQGHLFPGSNSSEAPKEHR
ncbi:3', 5'-cyclic nucleotide phosphodiesterase [Trypanosoma vivax]|nr:3', 5'-cyclic nucleotide phosphodiesterase [Trypanosoma vivax]